MAKRSEPALGREELVVLANFRSVLRTFLHFSEEACAGIDLPPQQHQLLLQIAGTPAGTVTAIQYLADRLSLRHHTVVELSKRCEEAGLLARRIDPENRRQVVLELTAQGQQKLRRLAADHWRELHERGPQLIETLQHFATRAPAERKIQ